MSENESTPNSSKRPQTQIGEYSDRLSNQAQSGRHESFRMEEDFFRQVIESLEDYAIFTTDLQGHISSWNKAATSILGYSEEEIIGHPVDIIFTIPDRQAGIPQKERQIASESVRALDERFHLRKDGTSFFASGLMFSLRDEQGTIRGFTKILRDRTQSRQFQLALQEKEARLLESEERLQCLNEELASTNKELQAANEELQAKSEALKSRNEELDYSNQKLTYHNTDLDSFIYKTSHDLKSPLTNLEGLLSLLKDHMNQKGWQDPNSDQLLQHMQTSLTRFQQTLSSLAQTAQAQIKSEDVPSTVSLANIVKEVQLDLQLLIAQSDAWIETKVESCHSVHFSLSNLKSVVYNLLSNAIKYRSLERKPHIILSCSEQKQQVVFSVSDNGLGITPEDTRRLFIRYQRFHTHVDGTGVGLYLVKKMVENEGGKIEVESNLGKGTTFRIYFRTTSHRF